MNPEQKGVPMFDFWKRKKDMKAAVSPKADSVENKTSLEDIWKILDHNRQIIALDNYISDKCGYGSDLSKLTYSEKIFFLCQELEREVNNGGFHQFFFNSSGGRCQETPNALRQIGAPHTASIVAQAMALFEHSLPADMQKRREYLEGVCSDAIMQSLEQLDNEFFAYKENLTEIHYRFVTEHRAEFH
jgi:hypothetical protein